MIYDNEYLKEVYNDTDLETFLDTVSVGDISDPRTRAVVAALKRSVSVLHLEFNPIPIKTK